MMLSLVNSLFYQSLVLEVTLKLFKPRCNLNVRKCNVSKGMVDVWNRLDGNIIDSGQLTSLNIASITICLQLAAIFIIFL